MSTDPAITPLKQWEGTIFLAHDSLVVIAPIIVNNEQKYDNFLRQIPQNRIQMRQPAPPNEDPLRERPAIDFDSYFLVVIRSNTWIEKPKLIDIIDAQEQRIIRYSIPFNQQTEMLAQPDGVGRYLAMLLLQTERAIHFDKQ